MTRKSVFRLLLLLTTVFFNACKEDTYSDWKILNDNKYASEFATTDFTKTESGLCYKIIYSGQMKQPNVNSLITVKYTGKMITGKIFDSGKYIGTLASSNYSSGTVAGWKEAITKLKVGGSMEMFFPYSLGYGTSASGVIPPYSMLYFTVELLDVQN